MCVTSPHFFHWPREKKGTARALSVGGKKRHVPRKKAGKEMRTGGRADCVRLKRKRPPRLFPSWFESERGREDPG